MARRNNTQSPYRSCQNEVFVVKENTFKIDEPRLRNSFGKVYDRTLEKNPPPKTGWRDHFIGAFIASVVSTICAGASAKSFTWSALAIYYTINIVLFLASIFFYIQQALARINAGSRLDIRKSVIDEAFNEIIEFSKRESQ